MTNEIIINGTTTIIAEGTHARKTFKPVMCLETGEIFASVTDAAKAYEVDVASISSCCRGKIRTVKGLHFFFVSKAMENLNNVADFIRNTENRYLEARNKAKAYDSITAEQNAKQAVKNSITTHKANITNIDAEIARLTAEREKEIIRLEEAKLDLKELLADDLDYLM